MTLPWTFKINRRALCATTLCLALLTWSLQGQSLPTDREQPIHITADKAVRDEKRGVTIYTGNVEMRQGSMELDADSLTIYHENNDANKIVARGMPAKMRQQPEIDKGLVHAHAEIITYFRHKELVHLRTAARIEREDGTLVTGDSIDYLIDEELVTAESDRDDDSKKVVVVIPPSMVDEETNKAGENSANEAGNDARSLDATEGAPQDNRDSDSVGTTQSE